MPSITMHRKLLAPRLDSRLAAILAAAGAAASTVPADATIIFTNLSATPITIPATIDGIYLNIVTNVAGATGSATPGWDINPYGTTTLIFFNPTAPTGGAYVVNAAGGSSATLPDNLPVGFTISAANGFGGGVGESTGSTAFVLNSSNNYVGFRLQNEATGNTINYGFAQISIGSTLATRSIVGYAYGNAGESINVSQIAIPEPSTVAALGAMALGALGVRSWRRQRAA